jgi:hypothetical protein
LLRLNDTLKLNLETTWVVSETDACHVWAGLVDVKGERWHSFVTLIERSL